MKKTVISLVLLAIVLFISIFLITYDWDQRAIKKRLNSLADTVSKSSDEGDLAFISKIGRLKSLFTKDCLIDVGAPIPKIEEMETLLAIFSNFYRSADEINVKFYDITVDVSTSRITAKTVMTAKETGLVQNGSGHITNAREIAMDWKKIDKAWKIFRVLEVKTLH